MKLGAQLYTIRAYTQNEKDFDCSMGLIAGIGYTSVQISAVGKSLKPDVIKEICDRHGLEIAITHSDPDRILYDTENLIHEHELMGCKYIGIGAMPDKYRNPEWLEHFADDFRGPARLIRDAGMLLMYHNHDFEFQRKDGRFFLDYMIEELAPDELGFTLDMYWLHFAGNDPVTWIERLRNRIPCIHLKDMERTRQGMVMAPVLEGNMNYDRIIRALEATDCEYMLVEQDICGESPFTCLKKSYDNLAGLGYR